MSWRTHKISARGTATASSKRQVCNQNLSRVYIRTSSGGYTVGVPPRLLRARAHVYGRRWSAGRQSRRQCNSQEGSGAKRLSGELACCSNGRRETGGIKLLQTITFNEKVNATSRGLARTWMQMCRRRVISKQSSPSTAPFSFTTFSSSSSSSFYSSSVALPPPSFHDSKGDRETERATPSFC